MYIAFAITFLIFFIPALGLVALIGWLTQRMTRKTHNLLLVFLSCLLLTPTWGPATIAVVPVTFGWWFVISLFAWDWPGLVSWVMEFPRWHAFAFPATALIAYLVLRWVRPNNSFKPTPLRGAA
jgi:hypothetical protein